MESVYLVDVDPTSIHVMDEVNHRLEQLDLRKKSLTSGILGSPVPEDIKIDSPDGIREYFRVRSEFINSLYPDPDSRFYRRSINGGIVTYTELRGTVIYGSVSSGENSEFLNLMKLGLDIGLTFLPDREEISFEEYEDKFYEVLLKLAKL